MENQNKNQFLDYYEPVHNQFCKFCRGISGSPEDAEDLIQDTIINVFEHFDRIKNLSVFKSYLFSVASNLHKMKLRRKKFTASFSEDEAQQVMDASQDQEYLSEFTFVYEKILSLPAKTSEALILYHISDMSLEEIRAIQGGSLSGVKSRLQRGREQLLSLLQTKEQYKVALMLFTF